MGVGGDGGAAVGGPDGGGVAGEGGVGGGYGDGQAPMLGQMKSKIGGGHAKRSLRSGARVLLQDGPVDDGLSDGAGVGAGVDAGLGATSQSENKCEENAKNFPPNRRLGKLEGSI